MRSICSCRGSFFLNDFRFPVQQDSKQEADHEAAEVRGIIDAAAGEAIIDGKCQKQQHAFPGKPFVMALMENNNIDQGADDTEDCAGGADRNHAGVKAGIIVRG